MPVYPALALLLGSAMAMGSTWIRRGTRLLTVLTCCMAAGAIAILLAVRNVPTPGDIFSALTMHPSAYTLSLGHMEDLTLQSFAYLRIPLLLAAVAFIIGALGAFRANGTRAFLSAALMMMVFFQAARLAMVKFDPDLSSKPLAAAIMRAPEGKLIVDRHYYAFSSIFFYTNRTALLLNGRVLNLSYGSYAPGAPTFSSTIRNSGNFGSLRTDIIWWRTTSLCPGWNGWSAARSSISLLAVAASS